MEKRVFGRTGMELSVLGFGCGAVGGLMVRGDPTDQERTIARAIDAGVNYFDTAVQYGNGESEKNLGRILQKLKPAQRGRRHQGPATEPAISAALPMRWRNRSKAVWRDFASIGSTSSTCTMRSPRPAVGKHSASDRCSVTWCRHSSGCAQQGKSRFLGLTAIGDTAALHQVIDARAFDSAQVVYNMLNPSAAAALPAELSGTGLWTAI